MRTFRQFIRLLETAPTRTSRLYGTTGPFIRQPRVPISTFVVSIRGREIPVIVNDTDRRMGYRLVPVDVATFDTHWRRSGASFYLDAHGSNRIGSRYQQVGDFLGTATSMEASAVSVDADGRVGFTDGRHRFAYLRDHGATVIPVAMDRESVANAEKYGLISHRAPK